MKYVIQNASTEALTVVMVTVGAKHGHVLLRLAGSLVGLRAYLRSSALQSGQVMARSLWDKHASPFGIACLMFCLVAARPYKHSPLRDAPADLPK